jgi:hypothetical protein
MLIKDIKKYSGKRLRFPKSPKYPESFYNFFKKILQVSPQLRMNIEEFTNHEIFNYTGEEEELKDIYKKTKKSEKSKKLKKKKNGTSSTKDTKTSEGLD